MESRDSSVGIALGFGLDDRGSTVRFLAGAGNFSLHHRIQNGSGAHPASYPMGTTDSFPGSKAAGAWKLTTQPPSSTEVKECVELYFHSPSMPSWRGAQLKHSDSITLLYFTLPYRELWWSFCRPRVGRKHSQKATRYKILWTEASCVCFIQDHAVKTYGNRGIAPRILHLGFRWRWSVSRHGRCISRGRRPRYPFNRRLGVSQSRSECDGEEKNPSCSKLLYYPGSSHWVRQELRGKVIWL
jgi:hypothetical protein